MSRVIAFAYADTLQRLTPVYRGLAEGLVKNVRSVMPDTQLVHVADDDTPTIPGVDGVLRVPRKVPLMSWHMLCHHFAHSLGDEVLFTEPDVRFRADILHIFDDPDFEIAVTEREVDSIWDLNGTTVKLSDAAPYTLGTTFSRSPDFWKDVAKYCLTLGEREQTWIGDMISLWAIIQQGNYKVKVIPGPVYNHIPCSREDSCDVKVLHYKGMRKEWLFQGVREA